MRTSPRRPSRWRDRASSLRPPPPCWPRPTRRRKWCCRCSGVRRAALQLRLLLVGLELLLFLLLVVLRWGARRARVVADLEALDDLVASALVEGDVVAEEDPVAPVAALLEDVLVDLRGVVDDEEHLGLRVEVGPGTVEDVLELESAGAGGWGGVFTANAGVR